MPKKIQSSKKHKKIQWNKSNSQIHKDLYVASKPLYPLSHYDSIAKSDDEKTKVLIMKPHKKKFSEMNEQDSILQTISQIEESNTRNMRILSELLKKRRGFRDVDELGQNQNIRFLSIPNDLSDLHYGREICSKMLKNNSYEKSYAYHLKDKRMRIEDKVSNYLKAQTEQCPIISMPKVKSHRLSPQNLGKNDIPGLSMGQKLLIIKRRRAMNVNLRSVYQNSGRHHSLSTQGVGQIKIKTAGRKVPVRSNQKIKLQALPNRASVSNTPVHTPISIYDNTLYLKIQTLANVGHVQTKQPQGQLKFQSILPNLRRHREKRAVPCFQRKRKIVAQFDSGCEQETLHSMRVPSPW